MNQNCLVGGTMLTNGTLHNIKPEDCPCDFHTRTAGTDPFDLRPEHRQGRKVETTIRVSPATVVPGDILYQHGQVLTDPTDIGCNTVIIETETGRHAFPADYRELYRVETVAS